MKAKLLCVAAAVGMSLAWLAPAAQAQPHAGAGSMYDGRPYAAYPVLPNPMVYPWAYGAYGGHHVSYEGYYSNFGGGVLRYPNMGLSTYGPYVYSRPASYYSQGYFGHGAPACYCQ